MFRASGIEAIRTPVRSPKANAFAERFVRTAREDFLDHLLIYSRRHLESVLGDYVRHYNEARPHRGLQLATHCLARTNQAPARAAGATSSAASSTSTTGPPDPSAGRVLRGMSNSLAVHGDPRLGRRFTSLDHVLHGSDLPAARVIGGLNGSASQQSAHNTRHRVLGPFRLLDRSHRQVIGPEERSP